MACSPVYYGLPSAAVKKFIDFTNVHHGKLVGKVGGAFANSAGVHGGCETTILALNNALLIHGMVIQGCSEGLHYGAAAVETPTEKDIECCKQLGARVAKLALKLHSS
ncbi:flavodoxin family protein [Pelomyxa schiedti]|nr:flavodoxin family protein [Pelomyxa schiedti]